MEGCSDAKMAESPEESSWTFYIQEFICDKNSTSLSCEHESPSLVSDAASSAVNKLLGNTNFNSGENHHQGVTLGFSLAKSNSMSKQSSFKKQKTKFMPAITDYDLEDTASSPANSPKVSCINQFMKQKEKAKMDISEEKKGGVCDVESDGNCNDLKKETTCD